MARMARVVAEGMPHHITQRGNRRQPTFFSDDDYQAYIDLMAEWCGTYGVDIWAYCLMPNHIHLIAVPENAENLRLAIGEAHRRYTRRINFREGWRGHLWQERFSSFVMDERYLVACVRYIENNPVRAKLTVSPDKWPWSSAQAHMLGRNDTLVNVEPVLSIITGDWQQFLSGAFSNEELEDIRKHSRTGRPLGSSAFVEGLEHKLGRKLKPQKPGRKRKEK
ncbi:MAG: transposase [Thermodesulfobacteriota bacterium]|nr:transposase [Thermodesulfobacteriota bacterium]